MRGPDSSLASLVETFLRSRHELRPLTLTHYRRCLERCVRFLGAEACLRDLTLDRANGYVASLANRKYLARADAAVLRTFTRWLVRVGFIESDPLAPLSLPRVPKRRPRPLPDAIVPLIVEVAGQSRTGARDRAIVLVALSTGARPNELRQLLWPDDVDLRLGFIRIRPETTKTAQGAREIPLDPQATAAVDEYVQDYRLPLNGPLFQRVDGRPFSYFGFLSIFSRLSEALKARGFEGFTAYRQRHTGITNFVRAGYTMLVVQQLAGHADPSTTKGYFGGVSMAELKRLPSAFSQTYGRVS